MYPPRAGCTQEGPPGSLRLQLKHRNTAWTSSTACAALNGQGRCAEEERHARWCRDLPPPKVRCGHRRCDFQTSMRVAVAAVAALLVAHCGVWSEHGGTAPVEIFPAPWPSSTQSSAHASAWPRGLAQLEGTPREQNKSKKRTSIFKVTGAVVCVCGPAVALPLLQRPGGALRPVCGLAKVPCAWVGAVVWGGVGDRARGQYLCPMSRPPCFFLVVPGASGRRPTQGRRPTHR